MPLVKNAEEYVRVRKDIHGLQHLVLSLVQVLPPQGFIGDQRKIAVAGDIAQCGHSFAETFPIKLGVPYRAF